MSQENQVGGDPAKLLGIGETLRKAREKSGKNIRDIAEKTKIGVRFLEALEREDFDALGGAVYVKLFLRTYGGELGVSGSELYKNYEAARILPQQIQEKEVRVRERTGRTRRALAVSGGVLVLAAGLLVNLMIVRSRPPKEPGPEAYRVELPPEPLMLNVRALDLTYVEVQLDGSDTTRSTLKAGEQRSWRARDTIVLKAGNALGLEVEVNGEPQPLLGARDQVVTRTFTRGTPPS